LAGTYKTLHTPALFTGISVFFFLLHLCVFVACCILLFYLLCLTFVRMRWDILGLFDDAFPSALVTQRLTVV
jgi:hypothetical protein